MTPVWLSLLPEAARPVTSVSRPTVTVFSAPEEPEDLLELFDDPPPPLQAAAAITTSAVPAMTRTLVPRIIDVPPVAY